MLEVGMEDSAYEWLALRFLERVLPDLVPLPPPPADAEGFVTPRMADRMSHRPEYEFEPGYVSRRRFF